MPRPSLHLMQALGHLKYLKKKHPPKNFWKSSTTSHLKDSRQSPAALRDPFRADRFTDSPIQSPNPRSSRTFATFNLYTHCCKLHRFQILSLSSLLASINLNYVLGICRIAFHAAKSPKASLWRICRLAGLLVWSKTLFKKKQKSNRCQTGRVFFWSNLKLADWTKKAAGFNLKKQMVFEAATKRMSKKSIKSPGYPSW